MSTKQDRIDAANKNHRERCIERLRAAQTDISDLWLNRHIWRTTAEIASKSRAVADQPYFMYWLTSQYAQAACVAIRRLTQTNTPSDLASSKKFTARSNSLVAVLEDIVEHSRAHPCRFLPDDYRATDGTIDPARVQTDIEVLTTAAAKVTAYVNKHLAHLERKPSVQIPTLTDIDTAVDALGEILKRYLLATTGADLNPVNPLLLVPWTSVFDHPWNDSPSPR